MDCNFKLLILNFKLSKLLSLILLFSLVFGSFPHAALAEGIELIPKDVTPESSEKTNNDSTQKAIEQLPSSALQEPNEPSPFPAPSFFEDSSFSSAHFIGPVIIRNLTKRSFRGNERVNVIVDNAKDKKVEVSVTNNEGAEVEFEELTIDEGSRKTVVIKPPAHLRPGKYTIEVSSGGQTHKQDFTWGVLAINTNKSIYLQNETVKLSMAVLDERGEMVCDASVKLKVKSEKLKVEEELSTENGKIKVNPACQKKEITVEPDYESEYKIGSEIGRYDMNLTAQTKNGTYSIDDSFEVRSEVLFDVERKTATRIYPPVPYPVNLEITANQDFDGIVAELVPDSFTINPSSTNDYNFEEIKNVSAESAERVLGIQSNLDPANQLKLISWKVNVKKGDKFTLSYFYKAPNISPQFYKLGPLRFYEKDQKIFEEARQWQLAIDQDGGGTNTVSPTTGSTSATGQTYTFTYTTGESVATGSGSITIQEPTADDWTVPQTSNSGAAGYTIYGSGTGTPGEVLDNADSNTNWNFVGNTACSDAAPTVDTTVQTEGTGDLKCINGNVAAGRGFYKSISSSDWTNYTTVGVWIRTSSAISTTSNIRFSYDDNAALASPIANVSMSTATTANTWTWETFTLTGTRNAIVSFGITYGHATALDSVTVWADYFLIGPGSPAVSGTSPWKITVPIITIPATTGTIIVTYGNGGGAAGVTNSASTGVHTFTTQSKSATNPTNSLQTIGTSPTVTLSASGPTKIAFSNASRTLQKNICNGAANVFTMELQNGASVPTNPNATTVVRVTSDTSSYVIYSDSSCTTEVTNGDFTYTTSQNTKSVYIIDNGNTSGTKTITGTRQSGDTLTTGNQNYTLNGPDKVAFSNAARTLTAGACNGTAEVFTMELQAGTTPSTPFATTVVRVTSDTTSYTIYSDNSCTTVVTNGDFTYTTAQNSKSVYIIDRGSAGTKTLTGTRQSGDTLTTGTQNYTLVDTPSTRVRGGTTIRGGTTLR